MRISFVRALLFGLACALVPANAARAGACCSDYDGSCTDVASLAECPSFLFNAAETCDRWSCATGACCEGDTCRESLGMNCPTTSGFSPGRPCAWACPVGACCTDDGGCLDVSHHDCIGLGVWQPGECFGAACPPLGACCVEGACRETFEVFCPAWWTDSPCADVRCGSVEACCSADGCVDRLQDTCLALGGTAEGSGTTCATSATCPSACCMPDGSCAESAAPDCHADGGVSSPGSCATTDCSPVACCHRDGSCSDTAMSRCNEAGDTRWGGGATCATVTCAVPVACCLDGGQCRDMSDAQCLAVNGRPAPPGSTCATDACPQRCCLLDGSCADITPAECSSAGGQSARTTCARFPCALEACCFTGACEDLTEPACTLLGGEAEGAGTTCDTVTCTQPLPGRVPSGAPDAPGMPLLVARGGSGLALTWSASCSPAAIDYSVHEGAIGVWPSHSPALCSTSGATTAAIALSPGDRYYLVAPLTATAMGSFGVDSLGRERPGDVAGACLSLLRGCP